MGWEFFDLLLFELVRKNLALDAEVRVLGGSGGDGRVREGEGEWPRRAAPEREEETTVWQQYRRFDRGPLRRGHRERVGIGRVAVGRRAHEDVTALAPLAKRDDDVRTAERACGGARAAAKRRCMQRLDVCRRLQPEDGVGGRWWSIRRR